ncbi:hypothetical protein Tdes44962_MAKER08816 [Teratosphaeria destructans]|uniref:Uncharacterized protein n=1 Tax=Teratosphaeria destructans TaxID=418781 RepID=A0A9W7SV29_9PEZI|nr:hypothetical protein Tdes44962_MAKER08816 [Teratosphaeria destructans]
MLECASGQSGAGGSIVLEHVERLQVVDAQAVRERDVGLKAKDPQDLCFDLVKAVSRYLVLAFRELPLRIEGAVGGGAEVWIDRMQVRERGQELSRMDGMTGGFGGQVEGCGGRVLFQSC